LKESATNKFGRDVCLFIMWRQGRCIDLDTGSIF
jgi:hypothetical protein